MAEVARSEGSSPDTDKDFDPTADMLVHDYDDECTLEEEEGMSGESCSNELDDLQRESDMPLEDLLVLYKVSADEEPQDDHGEDSHDNTRSSSEEEILSSCDLTLDKDEIARDLLPDDTDHREPSVNELMDSVSSSGTARLLRSANSMGGESSDESVDGDYIPVQESDWKKMIQIGSDYQASVPPGLSKYGDAPAYENEDRLLWDPSMLDIEQIEKYLVSFNDPKLQSLSGVEAIPQGCHIRDDEQGLYLLLQCGHNVEEALRRKHMQAVPPVDSMSLWSEEECQNFENGLRIYGKDFYYIQQNKVRTRSVGELVQFYYLWKKTERHDVFAAKTRLEKRKYALHPGITDYMDHFLDEQDNPSGGASWRDRSTSPHNYSCLIYGDHKYQQHHHDPATTSSPHKRSHSPVHQNHLHSPASTNAANNSLAAAAAQDSLQSEHSSSRSALSEPLHKRIKPDPDPCERNGRYSPCAGVAQHSHVVKQSLGAVRGTKEPVNTPPKHAVHIASPSPPPQSIA